MACQVVTNWPTFPIDYFVLLRLTRLSHKTLPFEFVFSLFALSRDPPGHVSLMNIHFQAQCLSLFLFQLFAQRERKINHVLFA